MQEGSPTDSECSNYINEELDIDPCYLHLHHNTMQSNWHQYTECTSMQVGILTNIVLEEILKKHFSGSSQLMNA